MANVQHYKNLLALRTDANGKPLKGYAQNVALLRKLIAEAEGASGQAAKSEG